MATYLDLRVDRFRLALRADCVLGVLVDVTPPTVLLRGQSLPLCDLAVLFTGTTRARAPFAVCFEAGDKIASIGVDRVEHMVVSEGSPLQPMPPFGLLRPNIFAGVLRGQGGLLLALEPFHLGQLTAPN